MPDDILEHVILFTAKHTALSLRLVCRGWCAAGGCFVHTLMAYCPHDTAVWRCPRASVPAGLGKAFPAATVLSLRRPCCVSVLRRLTAPLHGVLLARVTCVVLPELPCDDFMVGAVLEILR